MSSNPSSQRPFKTGKLEITHYDPSNTNGTIYEVSVQNFMCHDHVHMKFDKRINYFTGLNGSGKSAMMMAIVVGLGGKPRELDRGNNISSLIKYGSSTASISVTLNNKVLDDAYRHDDYGDRIVVHRVIRASGSSYKICGIRGNVVSTRKDELDRIIDAFHITVSNPVSCMGQEVVKKFLRQATPKSLFEKMAEGTGLDQIVKVIENTAVQLGTREKEMENVDDIVKERSEAYKDEKKELKAIMKRLDAKDKIKALELELRWLIASEAEKTLETETKKLKALGDESGSGGPLAVLSQEIEALKEAQKEKEAEIAGSQAEKANFDKELAELRKQGVALGKKKEKVVLDQKNLEMRKRQAEQKVQSLQKELERNDSQMAARRLENARVLLAELQPEMAAAQAEVDRAEKELRDLSMQIQSLESDYRSGARKKTDVENKIAEVRRSKARVESNSSDRLAAFPKPFATLNQEIQKRRWTHPPIGPLGANIKVKPSCAKWTRIIEGVAGKLLITYLVFDDRDARALNEIVSRVFSGQFASSKPTVTCTGFVEHVYDYARDSAPGDPENGVMNLMDALEFDNHLVENALVDTRGAHQMLLIEKDEVAMRLLGDRNRIMRNCNRAYTLNSYEFHPQPRYKSYYFQTTNRPPVLGVSGTSQAARYDAEIEKLTGEGEEIVEQMRGIRSELDRLKLSRPELETKAGAARRAHQELSIKSKKLESVIRLEQSNAQAPGELTARIDQARDEVQKCVEELQRLEEQLKECDDERNEVAETIKRKKAENGDGFEGARAIESELRELKRKEQEKVDEISKLRRKSMALDKERNDRKAKVEAAKQTFETYKAHAEALGERPFSLDSRRNKRDVERELEEWKRIANSGGGGMSVEQMLERKDELEKSVEELRNEVDVLKRDRNVVNENYSKQKTYFEALRVKGANCRRMIGTSIEESFSYLCAMRKLEGKLAVDLRGETLEVKISTTPHQLTQAGQPTLRDDMSGLSGGERSFTTIALILSIWDCCNSPFHMCDEFDVYLDTISRKIALTTIHRDCLRAVHKQFFFMSPQDDSVIPRDSQTTVHKMPDPVRVRVV